MTKPERLLKLIKLLEENKSLHIQDMVDICGVSHRTIYRDLNSLNKLKIPLTYNNGYELSESSGIPFKDLSTEDIDLIKYAISNNPLAENDFFNSKFKKIEEVLNSRSNIKNSVVEFEKQTQDNGNGDSTTVLATFFEAINNKKNINLKLKANENDWHHFSPMMVKISGKDISFIVRKNGDMEKQTISLDTIADIKIEEEYVPVK
ncbi:MAG: hypothetical protein DRP35_00575 [Candidatus Zixiibacteriota bacterium]|nr:MAG: hypothetical protein DRP35_00575 [candidate division Zixibacteria bacterium]